MMVRVLKWIVYENKSHFDSEQKEVCGDKKPYCLQPVN